MEYTTDTDINNTTSNRDKYFKGQQTKEELICFFRHHWITLIREFLYFAIFMTIVSLTVTQIDTIQEVLRGNRELKLFFFTGFMVGTLYMHRFFIKMLNYFVNIGIITDTRVIDHQKTLFFQDTMDSIDMAQIQNIEKIEDGILPSIFKFGNIKIFLNASDTVKHFNAVPNAKFHFRCINRQKEQRQLSLINQERLNRSGSITMVPQADHSQKIPTEIL